MEASSSASYPKKAQELCLNAFAYLQVAEYVKAEALIRKALSLAPQMDVAHALAGLILRARGRFGDAEREAREALRLQPRNPHYWFVLGLVLWSAGEPQEAERCFTEAVTACPGRADMLMDVAAFMLHQRRFPEALECARSAQDLAPDHPKIPLLISCAQEKTWKPEVDVLVYRPPLPLPEDRPELYVYLGQRHMIQGYLDFALDEFSRALDQDPNLSRVKSLFATAVKMKEDGFYRWCRGWAHRVLGPRGFLLALAPLAGGGLVWYLHTQQQTLWAVIVGALTLLYLMMVMAVLYLGSNLEPPEAFDSLVKMRNLTPQGRRKVVSRVEAEEVTAAAPRRRRSSSGEPSAAPEPVRPAAAVPVAAEDPNLIGRQMEDRSRAFAGTAWFFSALFVLGFIGMVWVIINRNTPGSVVTPTLLLTERILTGVILVSIVLALYFRQLARQVARRR
jgi:Tfp pilus assembly protein PilF